jgi:uncharacterized protein DUF6252
MNKLRLLAFLSLAIILVQSCKKDTESAIAYTTAAFQANINGVTWAPDTISSTVTYNSANKTKTFSITGTKDQKQVVFSVILSNASNTPGFTVNNYYIDSLTVFAQYNTQQLNSSNQLVFLPHGAVAPGSGYIAVTAVDSVKKQITGTFQFYSRSTIYDNQGNVVSTTVDNITAGEFTGLPYTFNNQ